MNFLRPKKNNSRIAWEPRRPSSRWQEPSRGRPGGRKRAPSLPMWSMPSASGVHRRREPSILDGRETLHLGQCCTGGGLLGNPPGRDDAGSLSPAISTEGTPLNAGRWFDSTQEHVYYCY